MGAPYIYDISHLRVNKSNETLLQVQQTVLQESRIPGAKCLSENNVMFKCQGDKPDICFYVL